MVSVGKKQPENHIDEITDNSTNNYPDDIMYNT